MAQIPRINQGERPSGVYSPTRDNSLANIAGALGDLSGAALETATAKEQAERRRAATEEQAERRRAATEELEQRKAYAAAQEEKQKIVDASNAGRIATEFDSQVFSLRAQLEQKHKDTPELFMEDYSKSMRSLAERLQDKEAYPVNDRVRLAAVRNAESTISSETKSGYGWVNSQQTAQVKGNLVIRAQGAVNGVLGVTSVQGLETYVANTLANLRPDIEATQGKKAGEAEEQIAGDIVKRYMAEKVRKSPVEADYELRNSKFLQRNLSGDEHAALISGADSSYYRLNDIRNLEIAKEAFAAGETLAASLGTDEFIPAASSRLKSLTEEKKNLGVGLDANGNKLRPEDAKKQADKVGVQIKRLKALMAMNFKQLDAKALDDVDTVGTLQIQHDELFTRIQNSSVEENLEGILVFQDALEKARGEKKITKAKYDVMKGSITEAYSGITSTQEEQYGFLAGVSDERAGIKELNTQFKGAYSSQPPEVQNNVRIGYLREMQKARKAGGMNAAKAIRIAKQVISRETGIPIPNAFE